PGLVATGRAAVAALFFIVDPRGSLRVASVSEASGLALFVLAGGLMSWLNELLHRAVHRAEASEARLRATLASIGDGVVVTDSKGRVQFLNPVAQVMTGWTSAQAAGQPLRHVFNVHHEGG